MGNPKAGWEYDVESDTRKIGTVNWREVVQDRETRRRITGEVLTVLGYWKRRRRRGSQCSVDNQTCVLFIHTIMKSIQDSN